MPRSDLTGYATRRKSCVPAICMLSAYLFACLLANILAPASAAHAGDLVWTSTGGPGGGQVRTVLLETPVALAGTIRGLYRSVDSGDTWSPVDAGIPTTTFVLDLVSTGSVVFAATRDDGLFRSTDQGETWAPANNGVEGLSVESLATGDLASSTEDGPGGSSIVYALTNEITGTSNLFHSIDGGASWQLLPNAPSPFGVVAEVNGVLIGSSAALQGMFRSTDGGVTWSSAGSGLPLFALFEAMTVDGTALFAGSNRDGIYRTTDDGLTWVPRNTGLPQPFFEVNDLAADGASILACFWGDGIYRSDDGGATWIEKQSGLPTGWGRFLFAVDGDGGNALAGLLQDGTLRSTNSGDDWIEPTAGITGTSITDLLVTGGRVVATAGSDRVFHRDNPGDGWESSQSGVPATSQTRRLGQLGSSLFTGTQTEGVLRSLDDGDSWGTANVGYPMYNGTAGNQYREVGAFASTQQTILVGTGSGFELVNGNFIITGAGVYRSTDSGATWVEANNGFPIIGTDNFGELLYDPVISMDSVGDVLLASTFERGIFRSTNDGASWAAANSGLPQNSGSFPEFSGFVEQGGVITGAAIGFAVGTGGAGIYQSSDSGTSWSLANNGIPTDRRITGLLSDAGSLYASVSATGTPEPGDGVYRSTDNGDSWALLGTGVESLLPGTLVAIDGGILIGTGGFGVWSLELLDPASNPESHPLSLATLEWPVPNPAREESSLSFSLGESRAVRLTLHDASGRLVRTLHRGELGVGRHTVDLPVADLATGVYYVTLRDGAGATGPGTGSSRRLIVVR